MRASGLPFRVPPREVRPPLRTGTLDAPSTVVKRLFLSARDGAPLLPASRQVTDD